MLYTGDAVLLEYVIMGDAVLLEYIRAMLGVATPNLNVSLAVSFNSERLSFHD